MTTVWPLMIALAAAGIRLLAIRYGSERAALRHRRALAIATGTVLTVCALGVMLIGTSAVTRVREYPEVYTQLWDLSYMTIQRDERMIPVLPMSMQPAQTIAQVRERWKPEDSLYLRFDPTAEHGSEMYSAAAAEKLRSAWIDAIKDHPFLYLRGRVDSWLRQIGIGYTPGYTFVADAPPNQWNYRPEFTGLSEAVRDYARWWEVWNGPTNGIIYHEWIYLLLSFGGLVLLLPRFSAGARMVGLCAAASVTSQIGLFFLSPAAHWRYQLFTAYVGMIVVCVAVPMLWRALKASRARPAAEDVTAQAA